MREHINSYVKKLNLALNSDTMTLVPILANALKEAWHSQKSVYVCGNGGSAGNAIHLANDFLYGVGITYGVGLRVEALSANASVLTCLANDIGYEQIYSQQLKVKANSGDILIVFSGSGNSPNVVKALEMGNALGMKTFAVLGFSGGKCKEIAQTALHFDIDDMQIAEDLQLIVGHLCMQWLSQNSNN